MLVLYQSGGADDFSIVGVGTSFGNYEILKHNVLRVLSSRNQQLAGALLEWIPFVALEATNHFGDDFSILHAALPLASYEDMRQRQGTSEFESSVRQIASTFAELGFHIRFIAVDLELESTAVGEGSKMAVADRRLTSLEINKLVNRYIGVSGGYLGDFIYQTHHDFYVDLDLDIDPYNYEGTTRVRFIRILTESPADVQARILAGILKKYPIGSSEIRTKERADEISAWIARLQGVVLPPRAKRSTGYVSDNKLSGSGPAPLTSEEIKASVNASSFRFDFGISFAGADRDLARQLRNGLCEAGFRVFFDEDYEHEMIGYDGSLYLRNVYSKECRFCVVIISQAYDKRDWTNLEREAVQARELRGERGILIPVPIEDYQPPWLPETRIRFDLWKRSIPELIALLRKRCEIKSPSK